MPYQLDTAKQTYGNQEYLAHNIKGNTAANDRYLFGQRVPSYGIINFGVMNANATKQFKPISNGINSDIMLRSIYPFTLDGTKPEITLRLYDGTTKIAEWIFASSEIPYRFPDGAIINPNLNLEIKTKTSVNQMLVYWQPVHVLSYLLA